MPVSMKSMCGPLCIIVLWIMLMKMPTLEANKILCPLSQDIFELKKYFGAIKNILHEKDTVTEVSLLKASALNKINPSERCCFLLKLGTFYVTNIFPQLEITISKTHKEFSHLANSMLALKIELKHCHATSRCPCGEQAHRSMDEFKKEYFKMETKVAALKAVGDMNILFNWLEKNFLG